MRETVDCQIWTVLDRVQVGAGRGQPPSLVDVPVEPGETFLLETIDIFGQRVTRLLGRREERAEERIGGRAAFDYQRAVIAAPLVATGQTVLHLLEVRQAMRVVPPRHARVGRPALQVKRVTALENHPVDAAGAAKHLAATVRHAPTSLGKAPARCGTSSRRTGCR